MALSFDVAIRHALLDAITTAVGASGFLRIYSGTPPATSATALSGNTQLATLPCSATFAPAASGGTLTVNPITADASAVAGTASFFRFVTSAAVSKVQGTVATSGGDLNLNTLTIGTGANVAVTSFVFTAANA